MKLPAKTLMFTMVSLALMTCETPQKTDTVVLLDPVSQERTNRVYPSNGKAKPDASSSRRNVTAHQTSCAFAVAANHHNVKAKLRNELA